MSEGITIVFDEAKRESNLAKHGYDFLDLTTEWFETAAIVPTKRRNRLMAVGGFGEVTIVVIVQPLGGQGISIISMRHASAKERKHHASRRSN